MKQKMKYHIISGNVIETRTCWMDAARGAGRHRGERRAGSTSAKKIRWNESEAVRRLARTLNCNFGNGLLHVVLKYSDARLPATREVAEKTVTRFLRKARREHERRTGDKLRYVCVTADRSPKRNSPARLHHHLVMDRTSLDMLRRLWPEGEFFVEAKSKSWDLTQLAAYLIANVSEDVAAGKKKYTVSKGLDKPIYTEPKAVDSIDGIEPVPGSTVVEAVQTTDEDGYVIGSYMRAVMSEPVRVRGGQVILPRRRKKETRSEYRMAPGIDE